jgi:hypothetical protein
MEPTAALHMLAKVTQRKSSEIVDLIDSSWREIYDYTRTMVTA